MLLERQRTDANGCTKSTSWGHWFEPSTAHRKALHKGFFVAYVGDYGLVVARIDASAGRDRLGAETSLVGPTRAAPGNKYLQTTSLGSARADAVEQSEEGQSA